MYNRDKEDFNKKNRDSPNNRSRMKDQERVNFIAFDLTFLLKNVYFDEIIKFINKMIIYKMIKKYNR